MRRYGVVVVILAVLIAGNVFGDGCFFPVPIVNATKAMPSIPSQRAVVVYRDGVETLVIESALKGEGDEFGWVIPLPSRPNEFEAVSSGFIETVSSTVQPEIIHYNLYIVPVIIFAIMTFIWFLVVLSDKEKQSRSDYIILFLLMLLMVSLCFGMFMSAGGGAVGVRKGVEVISSHDVGSYGLTVIEAESAEAVNEWLGANGFVGLNDRGRDIVTEYIADGWCFVAAKLKRDGDGYSVPHPLSMKFKSEKAVYPMRLTAMAESDVYLELFVISESGFEADGLDLEFRDTYKSAAKVKWDNVNDKHLRGFVCNDMRADLGHPEVFNFMWDGCVMSRLAGVVGADEMDDDILLKKAKSESYRRQYYSSQGAWQTGFVYGLGLCCLLVIFLTMKCLKKIQQTGDKSIAFKYVFVRSIIAGAFVAAGVFVCIETVDVGVGSLPFGLTDGLVGHDLHVIGGVTEEEINDSAGMTVERVRKFLDKNILALDLKNNYSGGEIKFEDSPGNFTVFEDERGVVLRGYLAGGFPVDIVLNEVTSN
ncbi:MAG: DUF2330 domain-containing protein [Anaerohalosphaera sp.]|nr:DUF2330 domain-containing protein [Anaerohalosphaera sp.]